jgi:hypothetical protein
LGGLILGRLGDLGWQSCQSIHFGIQGLFVLDLCTPDVEIHGVESKLFGAVPQLDCR